MENIPSFNRLPLDVLEHHVLPHLSVSSLVGCQLACTVLHNAWLSMNFKRRRLRNHTPNKIQVIKDIYKNGYANLLDWCRAVLKYPSTISSSVSDSCVKLAVQGMFVLLFIILFTCFLIKY